MPVFFFIPEKRLTRTGLTLSGLPATIEEYLATFPFYSGFYSWILQTHLWLKGAGFESRLVTSPPNEGIVVTYAPAITNKRITRSPRTLLVCVKADRTWEPNADVQIVQNPAESTQADAHYIKFWPQPGLIPRLDSRRPDVREIGFFGNRENLAPELRSDAFRKRLMGMGLTLTVHPADQELQWKDYSTTDVILGIRDFSDRRWDEKPPNKLVNAWCAGVPAIVGRESAFQALRQSELDYFEAGSVEDVTQALERLRTNPPLYEAMVANGLRRCQDFTVERVRAEWITFLENVAIPTYLAKVVNP